MERLRFAQDLHDGPLQEVIGVSYQVQELSEVGGSLEILTAPGRGTLIRVSVPLQEEGISLLLQGRSARNEPYPSVACR
jgi:signal transduction histidine kinase